MLVERNKFFRKAHRKSLEDKFGLLIRHGPEVQRPSMLPIAWTFCWTASRENRLPWALAEGKELASNIFWQIRRNRTYGVLRQRKGPPWPMLMRRFHWLEVTLRNLACRTLECAPLTSSVVR